MFELAATADTSFQFFLPLVKADEEKHLIYARAAAEEPDRSGEIMDYETAVPAFKTWSKQYADATMGKSMGNVRAMHNPRHLAGKVEKLDYDDAGKFVGAMIKILDPTDWIKVEQGGYTGISIGGGYAKKWKDPLNKNLTRYTPRIQEISLVDSPCIPSARIMELQKRDGTLEEVKLHGSPRSFNELKQQQPRTFDELQKSLVGAAVGGLVGRAIGRRIGAVAGLRAASHPEAALNSAIIGSHVGAGLGLVTGAGVGHLVTRRRDGSINVSKQEILANLQKANLIAPPAAAGSMRKPKAATAAPALPTGSLPAPKAARVKVLTPTLSAMGKAATELEREKIQKTMHEFKHGKLRSFRANRAKRDMPKVEDRRQAIAIALSQARRVGKSEESGDLEKLFGRRGPAPSFASTLTDAQRAERVKAAKARWMKEGHHDLDNYHDTVLARSKRAFLGRAGKVQASHNARAADWHDVADAQGGYDKIRKALPKGNHLMMTMNSGLLYNPEGITEKHFDDNGRPKTPVYMLHHSEADDWVKKHAAGAFEGIIQKAAPDGLIEHFDEIFAELLAAAA